MRELVGILLVRLVATRLPAPIAHDDLIGHRREQVMQPLGLSAFLERHVNGAAHTAEELGDRQRLGRQDGTRDHAAAVLPNRRDGRCLMYVQRHILRRPFHEGRSLV